MELHYESLEFRADALATATPTGMLRGMLVLAVPGVYTVRTWDNKTFTEYVPPETLADPEYVASLGMLPLTLNHPSPVPEVTPENAKQVSVGTTGAAAVRADGALQAPAMIWDIAAIQAAKTTHRQNSLGYYPIYDDTPGVAPNGQAYDRKQIKRVANHTALVQQGVHGSRAVFRADAAAAKVNIRCDSNGSADDAEPVQFPKQSGAKMATVKLGNAQVEIADASTAMAVQSHVDGLNAELTTAKTRAVRADAAEAERDAAKAEIVTIKAQKETEIAQIRADAATGVRDRIALELKVAGVCGKDYKCDGKKDDELRADALAALKVEVPAERRADSAYMAVRFDIAMETHAAGKPASAAAILSAGLNAKPDTRADAARPDAPVTMSANEALARQWG